MRFRAVRRAVALAFSLAVCSVAWWVARLSGPITLVERAQWLHGSCARVLRAFGIQVEVHGEPPRNGLVVANHLSYLDILIFGAVMPCFFVAKAEVASWPYFGRAARTGASIFIDRRSRASTIEVARRIAERLNLPIPILLFPEGTSTDGSQVLRFHSSLFEPAVKTSSPITAAAVRYVLHEGSRERDLCWYDDALFLPHLWKTLCVSGFSAKVTFSQPRMYPDRRTAAAATHDEVTAMRLREQLLASALSTRAVALLTESRWLNRFAY